MHNALKLTLQLTLAAAVTLTPIAASCAEPQPIIKAVQPVKIDGVLDDAVWKEAEPVTVNALHGWRGGVSEEPRMTAWYAWDDHYIYFAYEVYDTNLQAASKDRTEGPKDNLRTVPKNWAPDQQLDVVEFFLAPADRNVFWEIHQNALGDLGNILAVSSEESWGLANSSMTSAGIYFAEYEFVKDEKEYTVKSAVHLKSTDGKASTVNHAEDTDAGYTGEIRMPWRGIGTPNDWRVWYTRTAPSGDTYEVPGPWDYIAGKTLPILAVCQNSDHKNRYSHSSEQKISTWFHKSQDAWPVYQFVDQTADDSETAPADEQADKGESAETAEESKEKAAD